MVKYNPIGYSALIELFDLKVLPYYRVSRISNQSKTQIQRLGDQDIHNYAKSYALKKPDDPILNIIEIYLIKTDSLGNVY